ncbi:MAG: BrnT family toxin [Bryobacteraceae bacterium]
MDFDWDAENTRHISLHEVRTVETEQVLQKDPVVMQFQERGGEERVLVLGQTNAGRLLAVVYTERRARIRVVTAYPMTKRLEAIYFRQR